MPSTNKSAINGKAYEYACVLTLLKMLKSIRKVSVIENESLRIAKIHYTKGITPNEQKEMLASAAAGLKAIIAMEPRIIEDGKDSLTISLQPDNVAKEHGDIRDVLIIRRAIKWEIGISVKHNHAALKHSRLSKKLDFGKAWFGCPCSKTYFKEIKPIFDDLQKRKEKKELWSCMQSKKDIVYVPLLNAFRKELLKLYKQHDIMKRLVSYLVGSNGNDYYKLIHNKNHTTTIMPFNINGTLNKAAANQKPSINIPKMLLPTKIIDFSFKEKSKTTLILTLNNGWSISFRIHNADKIVESSLKFDTQLKSKPEDIFYLERAW